MLLEKTVFVSQGVSKLNNIISTYKNFLIYAAKSNIIITRGLNEYDSRIILRNKKDIEFLCVQQNQIIVTNSYDGIDVYLIKDVQGEIYVDQNPILEMKFNCAFCYNVKNSYYCADFNKFFVIKNNLAEKEFLFDLNITFIKFCVHNDINYHFVGLQDGKLQIIEETEKEYKVNQYKSHKDAITGIDFLKKDDSILCLTSSLDNIMSISIFDTKNINLLKIKDFCEHSNWITSAFFTDSGNIFSCSITGTAILWEFDDEKWKLIERFGIHGMINQNFLGAVEINNNFFIQSNTGGFYRYKKNEISGFCLKPSVSGHIEEITSLDVYDDFILSTSTDFTTRIWSSSLKKEIGRPQVHGHPIYSAKFLKKDKLTIVSGGEEMIIRVYEATRIFIENYITLKRKSNPNFSFNNEMYEDMAQLIPLNLSTETSKEDINLILREGNSENNLNNNFVFLEVKKLLGHYFYLQDIAVSKKWIISCNRSSIKKYSGLFAWDYDYKLFKYIEFHSLDIKRIKFSKDEKILIACSRDKGVSIYDVNDEDITLKGHYSEHNRVVNDCSISYDNKYIVSCSRDKSIVMVNVNGISVVDRYKFDCSVTAIIFLNNKYKFFVGLENGDVALLEYNENTINLLHRSNLHSNGITCMEFSSDGKKLISACKSGQIRITMVD